METSDIQRWTTGRKFIFLFIALYTFFYIFPFPFDAFPQIDFIFRPYGRLQEAYIHWVGKNIFGLDGVHKLAFSDSGDTAYDFAFAFSFLFLSAILALAIALIDKKKPDYEKSERWFFLFLRYATAFYMLIYGFDKVFKSHFPFPSLEKLEQPLGQSTPQGLLWAFMGYSTPYSTWLGIVEVLAGFLILFRRTLAIGSILALMIMVNVAIINFCYDVPVKLFALHMVAFCLLLCKPFFRSLYDFFVRRKMTNLDSIPEPEYPPFILKYKRTIKTIVVVSYTALFMTFSIENMKKDGDHQVRPSMYGIYKVTSHSLKPAVSHMLEHEDEWEEIIFDQKCTLIRKRNGETTYYTSAVDSVGSSKVLVLISNSSPKDIERFSINYLGEKLVIAGKQDIVWCKKLDVNSFPLLNRKFHWIVEYPFNN